MVQLGRAVRWTSVIRLLNVFKPPNNEGQPLGLTGAPIAWLANSMSVPRVAPIQTSVQQPVEADRNPTPPPKDGSAVSRPGLDAAVADDPQNIVSTQLQLTASEPFGLQSKPVVRPDGSVATQGRPDNVAAWLYGDERWGTLLATEDGDLRSVTSLMTPAARMFWQAEVHRLGAEEGRAIARLHAQGQTDAARQRLLGAYNRAPSAAYIAALTQTLGPAAVDKTAGLEGPYLLARTLNLQARDGTLIRDAVSNAADQVLALAERSPDSVANIFEAATPLVRRALLLEISARHEEQAIFTKYNEPTPETMVAHFFEMLPEAARARVANAFDGVLPSASIKALKDGRSWTGRHFPNITHAAQQATDYWAALANKGSIVAQLMGPMAALATEETLIPTLLTLAGARLGPGLFSIAPRTMTAGSIGMTSFNLTLDAQRLATGRDPWTDRATSYPDQLGVALRMGAGLLVLGTTAYAIRSGALQPIGPNEKVDMRNYVRVEVDQDLGRWEVWVPRATVRPPNRTLASAAASTGTGRSLAPGQLSRPPYAADRIVPRGATALTGAVVTPKASPSPRISPLVERSLQLDPEAIRRNILAGSYNAETGEVTMATRAEAMAVINEFKRRGNVTVDIGGEGRHPSAINLNINVLQTINEPTPTPNVILGSAFSLPFDDQSIDHLVVESAPFNPEEIARVLRPAGTVRVFHPAEMEQRHARLAEAVGGQVSTRRTKFGDIDMLETTIVAPPREQDGQ